MVLLTPQSSGGVLTLILKKGGVNLYGGHKI